MDTNALFELLNVSGPKIEHGIYKGKFFSDILSEEYPALETHTEKNIIPFSCGDKCNFTPEFVKYIKLNDGLDILLCNQLPLDLLKQRVRMPMKDPKFPNKTFEEVMKEDPGYILCHKMDRAYFRIVSLYLKVKASEETKGTFAIGKHKGKSYEEVFKEDRDYFEFLKNKCTSKNASFEDAVAWYDKQEKVVSSGASNVAFNVGKYKGRTFEEVLVLDPTYFEWLAAKYTGKDKCLLDAAEWYNKQEKPKIEVPTATAFPKGSKYAGMTFEEVHKENPSYFEWLNKGYNGSNPAFIDAIMWYRVNH